MLKRNKIVDISRGIAIVLVVGIHFFDYLHYLSPSTYNDGGSLIRIFGHGYYGVTIFFVISGYLITSAYARPRINHGLQVQVYRFYVRRASRILPLLMLVVCLGAVLIKWEALAGVLPFHYLYQVGQAGYGPGFWAAVFFFYFNWLEISWVPVNQGWFGLQWNILWSLAVEEQFYVLFPLILKSFGRKRDMQIFTIFVIFASQLLRAYLIIYGYESAVVYDNSLCCFDALLIGLNIALSDKSSVKKSRIFLISGTGFLIAFYFLPFWYFAGLPVLAVALSTSLVIQGSRNMEFNDKFNVSFPISELGKMSYGAYLWHPLALLLTYPILSYISFSPWIGFLIALVTTFIIAKLSFVFFEIPAENWLRNRFEPRGTNDT